MSNIPLFAGKISLIVTGGAPTSAEVMAWLFEYVTTNFGYSTRNKGVFSSKYTRVMGQLKYDLFSVVHLLL